MRHPASEPAATSPPQSPSAQRQGGQCRFVASLAAGKHQTIVAYGTSLTEGGAWVQQLQSELDRRFAGLATIVNSGKGAMWSVWGVLNLEKRVLNIAPDAVFLEFSINDAYADYCTTPAHARKNLETMIERIMAARPLCEIILLTMNPPTGGPGLVRPKLLACNQVYRDVAAERGLLLIDLYPCWEAVLKQNPARYAELVPDGLHPIEEGYEAIATPQITKALGL